MNFYTTISIQIINILEKIYSIMSITLFFIKFDKNLSLLTLSIVFISHIYEKQQTKYTKLEWSIIKVWIKNTHFIISCDLQIDRYQNQCVLSDQQLKFMKINIYKKNNNLNCFWVMWESEMIVFIMIFLLLSFGFFFPAMISSESIADAWCKILVCTYRGLSKIKSNYIDLSVKFPNWIQKKIYWSLKKC
jgi:hypothetical protein